MMKPSWMRKLVKSVFGLTKKNRSRPAFTRNIDLEQLENRLTPTTITNVGGLILILGSNGPLLPDDNLTISIANNQLTVTEANTTLTGTVFGIAAANNTVTIDFVTNAAAKALTGIQISLLSGDDTLNIVTGLDFRNLPINNNPVSITFDGDGLGSPQGKNIFTFQGLTSSKQSFVSISNFSTLINSDAAGALATISANGSTLSPQPLTLNNNGAMTLSATAAGSVAFEASGNASSIAINNQLVVNAPLFVRGTAATDKVGITSTTNTGTSFSGNSALTMRTQGDINIQGIVTLKNSFTVLDSENFTAQQNFTATTISMTNTTNLVTTVVAFNRNVTTSTGDFLITNLGNKVSPGAQFSINRDAITTNSAGLTFTVAGKFSAATTGGLYNLFLAGQTTNVVSNITLANKGSVTLGTVNIPLNPPLNASITSIAGFFDASAITGPTNLFADIFSSQYVTINGDVLVRSASSGTINRNFTIQAKNGNINIIGQIQLLDNPGNTALGSDLTLWAGIAPNIDLGSINIQSVIGVNRTLTINDCINFTSTSSIQVKSLVLQATGGDANLGAGQYKFFGNIGLLSAPTAITANSGGYGIQILGSANVFGSTAPAALSDFNNTGTVILGNSSSATINFTGGAIFHENTTVSGIGIISGNTRVQGSLAPGGIQTNGAGILTFTSSLTFEEIDSTLPPDFRKAVYYPEILGNVPGSTQDQVVVQSGFVLTNNPILYPVIRSSTLVSGNQFTIVKETDATPIAGRFSGLINLTSNTYSVLNEGDLFFASGGQFRISYTGGDGNDVVITFIGYSTGTSVFVDANNVLNVLGDNKASNVTTQIVGGVLNIRDLVFGLTGFAYGSKVVNNTIDIAISKPTVIGPNQFAGFQVQQNGGSDTFNFINVDLIAINAINPNVANVFFSLNGGPTSTPNQDIDILNITGLNQNVEIGVSGTSTVLIQGYDFIHSQTVAAAPSTGILNSANQGNNSLRVLGAIYYDIGDITFGSNNRADTTTSNVASVALVPATAGTITLVNSSYLGNAASLRLGNGSASNLALQSITGTQGGVSSNLTFNVARFNSVQNGTINNIPINVIGGNINVNGTIGTDIGNFNITNSGITVFNQSVDAAFINIVKNDGGINFKGTVGSFSPIGLAPKITIGAISQGAFITFQDNLTATSFNSTGSNLNYGLQFLGSNTTVTNNTNLLNTGGIVLGDSIDTLSFLGGLNIDFNSPVQISGTIQSQGAPINIASNNIINGNVEIGITLNSNSIVRTTFGPTGVSAPISLGRVFSNANSLTLDAGNNTGSVISIDELRGDGGSLIIINSAGATISQVGRLTSNASSFASETFGSISILDSVNTILFDGPILANKIITFEKSYNVAFNGSTLATVANDQRIFIITDTNPTVFRNRGDVTFGVNGSDSTGLMDFFIFNGGVDTTPITGVTNLAARIYTNNTNIVFDDISINGSTFLNTYLSSVAIIDFLDLGFSTDQTSNILNIFGYPNSSRFSLLAGIEVLPFTTGSISLSAVVNNGNTFSLNAGGPGASSAIVTGNIAMASYVGNFNESFHIYRAGDVTVFGNLSGFDMFFGTIANGFTSSLIELTGTVSIQGNFTVTNNFQVSNDVNNFAITGDVNTISAQNNINNIGFLQLGNSSTDILTSSSNLNVRGPAERRVAGLFNLTGARTLDFGPGITSLVANTVVNTNSQVGTTIGQINNNAFSLTINGRTQIQRYANDSQLSPYPSSTNPSSIIPINNVIGAGTGGGNVFLNGEVSVQTVVQSAISAILITDGGTGYTSPPTVVITGGGGSGATATSLLGIAAITRISVPGTGYVVNDAVTLTDFFGNSSAAAVVLTVNATGGITSLNLTSAGTGYTFTNFLTVTGGTGTGAFVRASANVVSVAITNQGSGYTSPPLISFVSNGNNGTGASAIANITVSFGFPPGNIITLPTDISLRKQGTGSVFLNTDSSATTAGLVTTIENGNFFFENAKINAATTTNVTGNGLLGGTKGTLGAVNVLPKGQLSPGNLTNPIGVLNLQGNLSVQSTYKVDIRSVAFNLYDQVNVTGAVSLAKNNVNGILDVAFTPDANVAIGNAFGIISNDGTDAVTGNFVTVAGKALTQNSTFTVNMPDGVNVATFQISYTGNIAANGTASLTGGNDVVIQITNIQTISSTLAAKSQNPNKFFAVSTDSGGGPIVKISFADGSGFSFFAYDTSFTGGVRTAIGDVNGDGNPDLITAAGPGGGPHVVIWTITAGVPYATVQSGFFAFEPSFTGGITLATGNINGDLSASGKSLDDIIVGAGAGGGPRVKAFAGNANFAAINNQSQLVDFFAYAPEFNLGVNVAAGDRTGDGNDEIITGAAQGGGPHVQVWQISNGTANSIQSFFAFDPTYLCGVFVGSGDLDGDGLADIYTGTGSGPIGSVAIYFGNGAVSRLEPFGSGFTGGVRVGAALGALNSVTNTYPPYLLTAAGPGGGPQVSLFDSNLNIVDAFFAFQENFTGGVLASTTVNN